MKLTQDDYYELLDKYEALQRENKKLREVIKALEADCEVWHAENGAEIAI